MVLDKAIVMPDGRLWCCYLCGPELVQVIRAGAYLGATPGSWRYEQLLLAGVSSGAAVALLGPNRELLAFRTNGEINYPQ